MGPAGYAADGMAAQAAQGHAASGYGAHGQFPTTPPPGTLPHAEEEVTERVRTASARPTMIVRHPRSTRIPIAVVALVGAAGALVGVWLAIGSEELASPTTARPAATPALSAPAKPSVEVTEETEVLAAPSEGDKGAVEGAKPGPTEVARPGVPEGAASAGGASAAAPAGAMPEGTGASPEGNAARESMAAKVPAETGSGPPDPAQPVLAAEEAAEPKLDPKKRTAKAGLQVKAAKPKAKPEAKRPEAKRSEAKRGQKAEPKEPSWDKDSPFLPVATPKR